MLEGPAVKGKEGASPSPPFHTGGWGLPPVRAGAGSTGHRKGFGSRRTPDPSAAPPLACPAAFPILPTPLGLASSTAGGPGGQASVCSILRLEGTQEEAG